MDAPNFLINILISILITLAVVLIPYIVIRLITHRKIHDKTAKIITVVYSIISFLIFLIIGILSESQAVSILPVIFWNALGYVIIRPKNTPSIKTEITESEKTKDKIDVFINPYDEVSVQKIDTQKRNPVKRHSVSKSIIVLSITTAIFCLSTIGLTIGMFYQTDKLNAINTELVSVSRENGIIEKDLERAQRESRTYFQENIELNDKLEFYDNHVVCINNGSNYYHKPDCEYFDDSSFYIYNTETAQARGYTECPYCF